MFKIKVRVKNDGCSHVGESVYIAGNFNDWNPTSAFIGHVPPRGESVEYLLENIADRLLEFKLSRGNWNTLACDEEGRLGDVTTVDLEKQDVVEVQLKGWRDNFPASTASEQVKVLDEAFAFPNLGVKRRVWIYLPVGYEDNQVHYPVLYMHDGQHIFDEATSRGRIGPVEWQVDETIDAAMDKAIVVAIEHAEDYRVRDQEYRFNSSEQYPEAGGADYLKDIVDVLKPYVDQQYRTLSDRKYTAIAGSSLGGLLNIYAGFIYPHVFGTVGIFSPSIWLDADGVARGLVYLKKIREEGAPIQHYYFYCGAQENRKMQDGNRVPMSTDMKALVAELGNLKGIELIERVHPQGKHGAIYWQKEFPFFYRWWQERLT